MFSWWFLGALRVPASRKVTAVLGKTLFILGVLFSKQLCFLNDAISLFSWSFSGAQVVGWWCPCAYEKLYVQTRHKHLENDWARSPKHRCDFVFRVCDGFLTSTWGSFQLPLKWECTLMHFEKHSCGNTHRPMKFKFMSVPMTTTNRKKNRNFRQCWPTNLQQILGREKASFTLALQYKYFFFGWQNWLDLIFSSDSWTATKCRFKKG